MNISNCVFGANVLSAAGLGYATRGWLGAAVGAATVVVPAITEVVKKTDEAAAKNMLKKGGALLAGAAGLGAAGFGLLTTYNAYGALPAAVATLGIANAVFQANEFYQDYKKSKEPTEVTKENGAILYAIAERTQELENCAAEIEEIKGNIPQFTGKLSPSTDTGLEVFKAAEMKEKVKQITDKKKTLKTEISTLKTLINQKTAAQHVLVTKTIKKITTRKSAKKIGLPEIKQSKISPKISPKKSTVKSKTSINKASQTRLIRHYKDVISGEKYFGSHRLISGLWSQNAPTLKATIEEELQDFVDNHRLSEKDREAVMNALEASLTV